MKNKTLKDYQKLVASGYQLTVAEIRHAFKLYEECLEYKNSLIKHYSEQEHERIVREAKANPYPTDWHNELILNEIKKEVSQKVKDVISRLPESHKKFFTLDTAEVQSNSIGKATIAESITSPEASEIDLDLDNLRNYKIVPYDEVSDNKPDISKRFQQLKDNDDE